jgi:hypothetical protein
VHTIAQSVCFLSSLAFNRVDESTVPGLFGTYNATTATSAEKTLSSSWQTAVANFIKDPSTPPAVNWPKYIQGNSSQTLAKIAYNDNVAPDNFVQAVEPGSVVSRSHNLSETKLISDVGWSMRSAMEQVLECYYLILWSYVGILSRNIAATNR